jgi:hypothetical protein
MLTAALKNIKEHLFPTVILCCKLANNSHEPISMYAASKIWTLFLYWTLYCPEKYRFILSYSQTQEKMNFSMSSYFIKHVPFLHIPLFKTANPVEGAGGWKSRHLWALKWQQAKRVPFGPNGPGNVCYPHRNHYVPLYINNRYGTPTTRQVSKRQVSKRQVSKRQVSKRPVSKHRVYKTSGLQNVRFQNVWFQNVWFQNVHRD